MTPIFDHHSVPTRGRVKYYVSDDDTTIFDAETGATVFTIDLNTHTVHRIEDGVAVYYLSTRAADVYLYPINPDELLRYYFDFTARRPGQAEDAPHTLPFGSNASEVALLIGRDGRRATMDRLGLDQTNAPVPRMTRPPLKRKSLMRRILDWL